MADEEKRRTIFLPEPQHQGLFALKREDEQHVAQVAVAQGGGLAILDTAPIRALTKMSTQEAKRQLAELIAEDAKLPKLFFAPSETEDLQPLPGIKRKGENIVVTQAQAQAYFNINQPMVNDAKIKSWKDAVMWKTFAHESKLGTFARLNPLNDGPRVSTRPRLTKLYILLYRYPPNPRENACIRGEECLMLRGDAVRGYKGRQFELPVDFPTLPPRDAGKCYDCISADYTLRAWLNYSGTNPEGPPMMAFNAFTVMVDDGNYLGYKMLPIRNESNWSGVDGHVPEYSMSYRTYDLPIPREKCIELGLDYALTRYYCGELPVQDFHHASAEKMSGAD